MSRQTRSAPKSAAPDLPDRGPGASPSGELPFWKTVPLTEMSDEQWESLCDGCGKCCLNKLIDEDTQDLYFTNVACRLLDPHSCGCSNYPERQSLVPDCIKLTPEKLKTIPWLPSSCAYRRLSEGRDLPRWHPLRTGDPESTHRARASVRGRTVSEELIEDDQEYENYIVNWI